MPKMKRRTLKHLHLFVAFTGGTAFGALIVLALAFDPWAALGGCMASFAMLGTALIIYLEHTRPELPD